MSWKIILELKVFYLLVMVLFILYIIEIMVDLMKMDIIVFVVLKFICYLKNEEKVKISVWF